MVLGAGALLEFDSPQALLQNPLSEFAQLVANSASIKRARSRGSGLSMASD
jgi:ABC-type proline/glycine betaine transport system ATPase subunit